MAAGARWTRRAVLGAAAVVAGTGAAVYWAAGPRGGSGVEPQGPLEFEKLLRRAVADLDMPCNPAEVFLTTPASGAGERDLRQLVTLLEGRVGRLRAGGAGSGPPAGPDRGVDRLIRRLGQAIKEDFLEDETCAVHGWLLSRTECRLAAVKLLWEQDREGGTAVACRREPLRLVAPPPSLLEIAPSETFVGAPFTVQPDGRSVINVFGKDFKPGAQILFGETALDSSVGHSGWMTASVPDELFAREGTAAVTVRNPDGATSNGMQFRIVVSPVLPPPRLSEIVPSQTFVGAPFTVQPNGRSVINVYGAGFVPGAEIRLGGTPLDSSVGHAGWMTAYVPDELFAREGAAAVTVRNPDGKESNAMKFEVVPRDG